MVVIDMAPINGIMIVIWHHSNSHNKCDSNSNNQLLWVNDNSNYYGIIVVTIFHNAILQ